MVRFAALVAAVLLLCAPALADPVTFTGRYNIVSKPDDAGVSISGYIDFENAFVTNQIEPDKEFKFGGNHVKAISVTVSGPGFPTLTADRTQMWASNILFDGSLGESVLEPLWNLSVAIEAEWTFYGELEAGEVSDGNRTDDQIRLRARDEMPGWGRGHTSWWAIAYDDTYPALAETEVDSWGGAPYATWWLELGELPDDPEDDLPPIPEPSTWALIAAGGLGLLWLRRRRKSA